MIWQHSTTTKVTTACKQYGRFSLFYQWLLTPPAYLNTRHIKNSFLINNILVAILKSVIYPLLLLTSTLQHGLPTSFILKIKLPAFLKNSLFLKKLAEIRVESALWLVIGYILIDYFLRLNSTTVISGIVPLLFSPKLASLWDEFLLLFLIVAWPVQMAWHGKLSYRPTPLDIPIVFYLFFIIFLFLIRSPNTSIGLEGLRVYAEYILWFFIATNLVNSRSQLKNLTAGLIGIAAIVAFYGIYQYAVGAPIPSGWVDTAETGIYTRAFSFIGSPNVLGCFLTMIIPIALSQIIVAPKWWQKTYYLVSTLAMIACLLFTLSRGAWLALVVAVSIFILLANARFLPLLFAFIAGIPALIPEVASRISYLFSTAYVSSSQKAGRLERWDTALAKINAHPLVGEGFGRFGGAVAARNIPDNFYIDNFYLKTAVESGLLGLLALLWLLLSGLRLGFSTYQKLQDHYLRLLSAGILAGLTGVLVHNLVENIFEVPMMIIYFWFLMGILLILPRLE